jgi:tetratricopeptide (TPR) repeat protein
MDFLNYSYLQSGQEAKARAVTAAAQNVAGANDEDKAAFASIFAARDAIELHRWKDAAALPIPNIKLRWQDSTYWARTIGAARSGDTTAARINLEKFKQVITEREKFAKAQGYTVPSEKPTDLAEAEAWILFGEGKQDEALKDLRAAADREDKEGDSSLSMPAREMLGDMLFELKRPADALNEYKVALKNSPNRFDSVYGAALAAKDSGDAKSAHEYEAKLVEISGPGADRPELATVRTLLAKQ